MIFFKHVVCAVALALCLAMPAVAQDCHIALRGKVLDSTTGEVLAFATVSVAEQNKGAVCDENGRFVIADLCEKTKYTVQIKHIQCSHFTQAVNLTENTEMTFYLTHDDHTLNEVIVLEKAVAPPSVQASMKMTEAELSGNAALGLGEMLKVLPGVSSLNTGLTISKPIVQGLHSNRLGIVSNGVTIEGQQWGTEHAPEVDPFSAARVSVIKGVAGVRYGMGNLAGLVVLEPAPLRSKAGVGGWATLQGFSNGKGGIVAASADWHIPSKGLSLRLQGTFKRGGNLHTPDYFLWNSGIRELNLSGMAAWKHGNWQHEASGSRFNQIIGILRAAHIGNTTDLRLAIEQSIPLNNIDSFAYSIGRPFQHIEHNLGKWRSVWRISDRWRFSFQESFQYNRRKEFDAHKPLGAISDENPKPQIVFNIATNTVDAALEHNPIRHWQGGVGVQQQTQYNFVTYGSLIPDFLRLTGGIWATERWRRYPSPWEVEFGARYDYQWSHITDTVGSLRKINTKLQFANPSASAGLIYHVSERLNTRFNTGLAWRAPNVNELFARGVHHGSATYEEGDPTLQPEYAWNNSISVEYNDDRHRKTFGLAALQVTVYHNRIADFIYLNPEPQFVLSIRGAFPAFTYQQADAVLQGIDFGGTVRLWGDFFFEGKGSVIRARYWSFQVPGHEGERHREWLPLIPSDRFAFNLRWDNGKASYVQVGTITVLRQTRFPQGILLKEPPPAYTLVGFNVGHRFRIGKQQVELGCSAQNLMNTRYRDYTDFFRFFVDQPGTNIALRAKWIWD